MTVVEHEHRTAQIQADNAQYLRSLNVQLAETVGRQRKQIQELEAENAGLKTLLTRRLLNNYEIPRKTPRL